MFLYAAPGYAVEDQPAPKRSGKAIGFERRLTIRAEQPLAGLYYLAAAGPEVKPLGDGRYQVGAVTIGVRADGASPVVRTNGGRQELLVPHQRRPAGVACAAGVEGWQGGTGAGD
jgi:hypothetical protein